LSAHFSEHVTAPPSISKKSSPTGFLQTAHFWPLAAMYASLHAWWSCKTTQKNAHTREQGQRVHAAERVALVRLHRGRAERLTFFPSMTMTLPLVMGFLQWVHGSEFAFLNACGAP
jgi:hypothetical protein